MQKTYHAITIANQLIKFATDFNVSINSFKVQYILFLLQSSEIRFSNRKIFTERMQRVGWVIVKILFTMPINFMAVLILINLI